jgi:hypothetical protein
MTLSERQFEHLAGAVNDPEIGGFTTDPRTGDVPTNRFMVGTPNEGRAQPLPATGKMIGQYASERSHVLGKQWRMLGGWQEGGKAHLDTPRAYPTSPAGDVAARHATLRGNEIAFGVMGSADEGYVGDVDNPYHAKAMTGDITPGNPEDARTWADIAQAHGGHVAGVEAAAESSAGLVVSDEDSVEHFICPSPLGCELAQQAAGRSRELCALR